MAEEPGLATKAIALHDSLEAAALPHALGGALALAYCVLESRATADVDMNIFVDATRSDEVLAALPPEITWSRADRALLLRDGQARLRWGRTPIDIFLSTHAFHGQVGEAARLVPFGDRMIPVLSCQHLAVFKTFFNRPKDYVDIADMAEANSFDVSATRDTIATLLGDDASELDDFGAAVEHGRRPNRDEPGNRFPRV